MVRTLLRIVACVVWPAWILAAEARGDSVVIVVDEGPAATTKPWQETLPTLVAGFRAAGHDVSVFGVGRGGTRVGLRMADESARLPAGESPFDASADPREALRLGLERHRALRPLWLVLLGPFDVPPERVDAPEEAAMLALATRVWSSTAPVGSRLLTPGLSQAARQRLLSAKAPAPERWHEEGFLVCAAEALEVVPEPWSPLDAESVPLVARVAVNVTAVALSDRHAGRRPFALVADGPEDRFEEAPAGETGLRFLRARTGSHVATIGLAAIADRDDLWLVPLPRPRTFEWSEMRADARLEVWVDSPAVAAAPTAAPVAFLAEAAEADRPAEAAFLLRRSLVGAEPRWRVSGPGDAALPPGLAVAFDREVPQSATVAVAKVVVRYDPPRGAGAAHAGSLFARAAGFPPLELPYRLTAPQGRIALELEVGPDGVHLPSQSGEAPLLLRLRPLNGNAPQHLELGLSIDPPAAAMRLGAALEWAGGRATLVPNNPSSGAVVPVGTALTLRLELPADHDLLEAPSEGTIAWVVRNAYGAAIEGEARTTLGFPRPDYVLAGPPTVWLEVVDGTVHVRESPIRTIDKRGLEAHHLGPWLDAAPRALLDAPHEGLLAWVPTGVGKWRLEAQRVWTGTPADLFDSREERVALTTLDPRGTAIDSLAVHIDIPPRWGARGWLLVALATLALGFVGLLLAWMRPPPLAGTLLYTSEGLERTVGRIDLAPVGRGRAALVADARGRLSLARGRVRAGRSRDGGTAVGHVEAERVGGTLRFEGPQGAERRLLVEGATFDLGRHRVRYATTDGASLPELAAPVEVADLLGPEHEMPRGHVD